MMPTSKSSPLQMIEAIRACAVLPGAEPHREILLDAIRLIASATVAAADLNAKLAAPRQLLTEGSSDENRSHKASHT